MKISVAKAYTKLILTLSILLLLISLCQGANISMNTNFAGGNVLVQQNENNTVRIAPDLRGGGDWFYWYFEASADEAGWVQFILPPNKIGFQGPAVSLDGGTNWVWMGTDNVKIWSGEGSDSLWSSMSNWKDIVPVDNADDLVFAGTSRLNNVNDLPADWRFKSVTFAPTAGAFVLNGNAIAALASGTMGFNNLSANTATINLPVHAGTRTTSWTTSPGDIMMNGDLSSSAASSIHGATTLTKDGLNTLTLGGEVSFSATAPSIKISGGTLVLDLDAGGSMTPSTLLHYGLTSSNSGDSNYQGGTLAIRGKRVGTSSQTLGNLTIFNGTSIARIRVDPNGGDGTTLTVGNTWGRTGNCFLHIDLSKPNATLASTPAMPTGGIVGPWCTVTDTVKTGFATTNAVGQIIRNAQLAPYPWGVAANNTNYVVTGGGTVGGTPKLLTLTIQGGGTFTNGSWGYAAGLVMEEGVSDYTFALPRYGSTGAFFWNQYSTVGNLIFSSKLQGNFYKTGPGTVILKKNTDNTIGMNVMEGLVQTEAILKGNPNIFNGGHLGGFGSVEGNLTVYPGGTLEGSYTTTNALTVTGNLLLKDRASVSMELTQTAFSPLQVTGTVTNQGADLSLTLNQSFHKNQEVTLLTSDTAIEGTFTSVNGTLLSGQNTFLLSNATETYRFELLSSPTRVWVNVVTEPGTMVYLR